MKRLLILLSFMLTMFVGVAQAQDDMAAAQNAWMEYMTPGDVHKMMAVYDGEWKTEMTFWTGPEAEPMKTEGTCVNEMILGGRYQKSTYSGDMMGSPFKGIGMLAYDKSKNKFYTTWIDNMGTGLLHMEGEWNDGDKSITFTGTMYDPAKGEDVKIKQIFRFEGKDKQIMEMYMLNGSEEFKSMEAVFTRK